MQYKLLPCRAAPGHTIEGLIKLFNSHSIPDTTLKQLVAEFNRQNPEAQPPKPGMEVMIPVLVEYCGEMDKNRTTHTSINITGE